MKNATILFKTPKFVLIYTKFLNVLHGRCVRTCGFARSEMALPVHLGKIKLEIKRLIISLYNLFAYMVGSSGGIIIKGRYINMHIVNFLMATAEKGEVINY